jgi:orotate phosphoribosyltransferase
LATSQFLTQRDELHALLLERSVRFGDFILASGKRSSYYVDARLTTMSGQGQVLLGRVGLQLLDDRGWNPQAIGGLTLGADPISYAIAHEATLQGRTLDAFTVRKEAKGHGAGRLIEGGFESGMRVVVIEDVITTGESALRALGALRDAGGQVLGVLAVVDRQEGGRERIESENIPVITMFTASELTNRS